MRYLTVIYYDTFARFFAAIEDEIKRLDQDAEVLHLAIFPSGWLPLKLAGRRSVLLPLRVMRASADPSVAPSAVLDTVSRYHREVMGADGERHKGSLRKRAAKYVRAMTDIVAEFSPDAVIFSGDTRIACEALEYVLDSRSFAGPRFYFEQGPNGTTILDPTGVNANVSFREALGELTGESHAPLVPVRSERYRRRPFYRGIDHILVRILGATRLLPVEWRSISLPKYPPAAYDELIRESANVSPMPEVLVALQVPDDANNIHHNPLALGDAELVNLVREAVGGRAVRVRVREHPLYRRRYTPALYEAIKLSDDVILSGASLDDDLANASSVVSVNSTTGVDAYLRGCHVIVLGNAYYDHLPGIDRVSTVESLRNAIGNASRGDVQEADPSTIFAEFAAMHLIPGHYLDATLAAPKTIAERVYRSVEKH